MAKLNQEQLTTQWRAFLKSEAGIAFTEEIKKRVSDYNEEASALDRDISFASSQRRTGVEGIQRYIDLKVLGEDGRKELFNKKLNPKK